jgi:hypothetical protein
MKRRSFPLFEKNKHTVFQELGNWEHLVERLEDLRLERYEAIYLAVVGSKEKLPQLLRSRHAPRGLEYIGSNEKTSLFAYRRRYGLENKRSVGGKFIVAQTAHSFINLVLCIAESSFWRHGVLHVIDSLYPRAALPFLTQKEMQQILRHAQRAIQPRALRVLEFSSKKRLPSTARKRFQSVREWTDAELGQVFSDAKAENVWFRSVTFDLIAQQDGRVASTGTHALLSKYGYFSCNQEFGLFQRTIIRDLVEFGSARLRFFSGRDRLTTPSHAPKPLYINYEIAVFRSQDELKRFIAVMKGFRRGTCTVLHANPYVHLSLVDNRDYSSADVWVLSQDQILVVPQLRASAAALKRIVNHIFENFREGEVTDVQEQPR